MTDKEIIEYWTHKINVDIPQKFEEHSKKIEKEYREREKTSRIGSSFHPERIIPQELIDDGCIPVHDYEILQRNNVVLLGGWWSCCSGKEAYRRGIRFERFNLIVAYGTPIIGFYKIVRVEENKVFCYYNSKNAEEFVTQEIYIHLHQLLSSYTGTISEGSIIHVESLELVDNRYHVKWHFV